MISILGPGHTKWCWAGTVLLESLPGSTQPGREFTGYRERVPDTGPHRAVMCWNAWELHSCNSVGPPAAPCISPPTASRLPRSGVVCLPTPQSCVIVYTHKLFECQRCAGYGVYSATTRFSQCSFSFPSEDVCSRSFMRSFFLNQARVQISSQYVLKVLYLSRSLSRSDADL
jgi:hypothetical protein